MCGAISRDLSQVFHWQAKVTWLDCLLLALCFELGTSARFSTLETPVQSLDLKSLDTYLPR